MEHPMEQCGLGIDEESSNANGDSSGERSSGATGRRTSFEPCIRALVHACQCHGTNCRMNTCDQMKRILAHARLCTKRTKGTCQLCRQLLNICYSHAISCEDDACQVPLCPELKVRLKQKLIQKRHQQNKSLQRRTDLTRGATDATLPGAAYHPHYTGQQHLQATTSAGVDTTQQQSGQMVSSLSPARSIDGGGVAGIRVQPISTAPLSNGNLQQQQARYALSYSRLG